MALAPNCLRPGSCKPVPRGLGQGRERAPATRLTISCSKGNAQLQNEEDTHAEPRLPSRNTNGSEPTVSNRTQSLREQLRLLNLESLSKRVLRATPAPRKLEDTEDEKPSRAGYSSRRPRPKGGDSWRPPISSVVGEVLEVLKNAEESEEGVVSAMEGWQGALNPRDVVTLLNALDSWQMALSVFRWLQAQESSCLNIYTYNVMLKVLRRGRQWKLAEAIAEDMVLAGILPDNYTYSTIISCASRCNYQDDALKWFDRMHEAGCVPDEVTYSSMIDVYGKSGRFDEAVALYEGLREAGWKPDRVTFGTMVKIYGKAGNSKQAVLVFREMKESGIQPDSVIYNTLISLLGRLGRMNHAMKIFGEMERTGVKPNAITLSTVIETHSRAGNAEEGLKVFYRLKQEGVVCDAIVYNTIIKMCGEAGLVTEADQFFREMIEAGCVPNDWTYKNMISLLAKRGMAVEAQRMFTSLVEAGYLADVMAYTSLLRAYGIAKDYEKFVEVFDNMLESCRLDERLCGVLLNLLTLCDTREDLELVRKCLRLADPKLDDIVGQMLEEVLSVDRLESDSRSLLSEVPEDAHKPYCNSLLDLCWNKGNRDNAFHVLSVWNTLGVYHGLQTKSSLFWCLHLRSLSASAAHCALLSWLASINIAIREGQELPSRTIIETGAGRQRGSDEPRLNAVISSVLKEMKSPFEESVDRRDWLVATGSDISSWLKTQRMDLPMNTRRLL